MADPITPAKNLRLKQPLPKPPQATPPSSVTSTPSTTDSDPFAPDTRSLPPVVFTSGNPISIRRYKNSGSFSQPLRQVVYPPMDIPDHTPSQTMGGDTLAREISASSKQSGESSYYMGSPIYQTRAKSIFKQHEAAVADIMGDIGHLEICRSGDTPFEELLARDGVPENATLLHDFRREVKSGDIKSPVSSPSLSSIASNKPLPVVPPRPKKLQRRPRKDSVKTPIHGGMISSPLEASMDVHPGEITRALTVADGVLQYSPYESLRSYNLSQPTAEEEEKFFADLVAQINKNIASEAEPTTPTRDSYASMSSAGMSVASDGTLSDLSSEKLLAARKENTERYGW